MDFNNYHRSIYSREELVLHINRALEVMSDSELESLYYEMLTKEYIKE